MGLEETLRPVREGGERLRPRAPKLPREGGDPALPWARAPSPGRKRVNTRDPGPHRVSTVPDARGRHGQDAVASSNLELAVSAAARSAAVSSSGPSKSPVQHRFLGSARSGAGRVGPPPAGPVGLKRSLGRACWEPAASEASRWTGLPGQGLGREADREDVTLKPPVLWTPRPASEPRCPHAVCSRGEQKMLGASGWAKPSLQQEL